MPDKPVSKDDLAAAEERLLQAVEEAELAEVNHRKFKMDFWITLAQFMVNQCLINELGSVEGRISLGPDEAPGSFSGFVLLANSQGAIAVDCQLLFDELDELKQEWSGKVVIKFNNNTALKTDQVYDCKLTKDGVTSVKVAA